MNIIESIFKGRTPDFGKLCSFGFKPDGKGTYLYSTTLEESGFEMTVSVSDCGEVDAAVIDPAFGEPYTLHLSDGATGSFVGGVREEYELLLTRVSRLCFEPDAFGFGQAKELIVLIRDEYKDEPEYLWEKFAGNAVWRRKDTGKWYGVLMSVSKRKLGFESDEMIDIVDLHAAPEDIDGLLDCPEFFPGWHMNKRHWFTVILDGSVPNKRLCKLVDESYRLAK